MPRQPSGLFGDTPAAVRQQLINEQLGQAQLIGNLGPGGHGALAGGMLGRGVSGLLGAPDDPRLGNAQALQEIEQEVSQLGLEPGTPEFTRQTVGRIRSRLGEQAAIQAWQMATELESQRAEVEAIRQGPQQAARKQENIARALIGAGYPEGMAVQLAQLGEVGEKILAQALKPEQATTLARDALKAAGGDEKKAEGIMLKRLTSSGVTVNNFSSRPLSDSARNTIRLANGQPLPFGVTAEQANELVQTGQATQLTDAQLAGERTLATEGAKLEAALADLPAAIDAYEKAALKSSAAIPGTLADAEATQARTNLEQVLAAVLSKGAEPNPGIRKQVAEEIPDYQGLIDRPRFPAKMKQLRRLKLPKTGGRSKEAQKFIDEARKRRQANGG